MLDSLAGINELKKGKKVMEKYTNSKMVRNAQIDDQRISNCKSSVSII